MQYLNKFYCLQRTKVANALQKAISAQDYNPIAKEREKVVLFYQKNGLRLTQEAFEIKRSTLFNWQKQYNEFGIAGLLPGNRCPKHKRKSEIGKEIEDFILDYRKEHGNIHKDEIKPHLDEYCKKEGIKTISISSIGRIIRKLKDKGLLDNCVKYRFNAGTGILSQAKEKKIIKERIGKYKPQQPGDLVQADSVHLRIDGKKRYFINAIDVFGKVAFSQEYDRLNSMNAEDFFKKLRAFYPFEIRRIQTDNGSEFAGYAHDYLKANKLMHFFTYPNCPKSNAFIERFNRTIKEQFVYRNEDCIEDCQEANERIRNWLIWYNTKRYHRGLNYQIPLVFTLSALNIQKSNML